MNPNELSYDEHENYIETNVRKVEEKKDSVKDLIFDSYDYVGKYIDLLPEYDRQIAEYYYVHKLTQSQIAELMGWSQAGICRRLRFILERIRFFIKKPSLNPLTVNQDFKKIFPENLLEVATVFYWEHAQNRVKNLIETSQSGAANKFYRILEYLEETNKTLSSKDLLTHEEEEIHCLVLVYIDYFDFLKDRSGIITYTCKKNDEYRAKSLVNKKYIYN